MRSAEFAYESAAVPVVDGAVSAPVLCHYSHHIVTVCVIRIAGAAVANAGKYCDLRAGHFVANQMRETPAQRRRPQVCAQPSSACVHAQVLL